MNRPSLKWQFQFLLAYLCGDIAKAPPFAMVVDVTRRCNLACLHCRNHSPFSSTPQCRPEEMDFPIERFRVLCADAKKMGIKKIFLIGEGEPMLHPDILDMVSIAKAAGCKVEILTNGTILQNHHAASFVDAGLDELHVTLWATNKEEYKSLYPGTSLAMFDHTIAGIQSVVEAKRERDSDLPRISLHRPIEPRYFRSIDATLTLAEQLGCNAVFLSPLKPLVRQENEYILSSDEEDELMTILSGIETRAKSIGIANNIPEVSQRLRIGRAVWEHTACYIGWVDVRIRTDGNVVPCDTCNWVMGNIQRNSLPDIWNNPAFREFRRTAKCHYDISGSGHDCLCDFCCHVIANVRLHRILKWITPKRKRSRETTV